MSYHLVGRCSNCGGNVTLPEIHHSVTIPVPTCQSCGATKKNELPIIEMEQPKDTRRLLNEWADINVKI